MRRQLKAGAALGAALVLGGLTTASTASTTVPASTAVYRSVTLASTYDVRLVSVRNTVVAGSITGVTVVVQGDVSSLLTLTLVPRPVRLHVGVDGAAECTEELLTLNDRVRATCTLLVPEDAARPRPVTVRVG